MLPRRPCDCGSRLFHASIIKAHGSAEKKTDRYTEIRNSKALRDYFVDERFEAGIQLRGTEVKSIRAGRAQINDAFGRIEKGELWLHNAHIEQYAFGNIFNHDAKRIRKLLLHRHQVRKIQQALDSGGRALVPLRMYFKEALVKVEVALCTGKSFSTNARPSKRTRRCAKWKKALKSYRR
ncbi:MAG: SsrA-binding protein SmpB [Opitutus sp.]|nr:SsrA-binding protein SmpB [Opitutus sp.]